MSSRKIYLTAKLLQGNNFVVLEDLNKTVVTITSSLVRINHSVNQSSLIPISLQKIATRALLRLKISGISTDCTTQALYKKKLSSQDRGQIRFQVKNPGSQCDQIFPI